MLMRHLHQPLRDSAAPNVRAVLGALERGLGMLGLRGFAAALYLESAAEDDLRAWADTYALAVDGLSDAEIRAGLAQDVLTRHRTTERAIERAILRATGVPAALRPSSPHVARYDQSERAEQGYRMRDYAVSELVATGIPWGGAWGGAWPGYEVRTREDDPTHLGYRGLTPRRETFGPGGFIVYLAREYDADVEQAVLAILSESAAAMSGYTLFWSHRFARTAREALALRDHDPLHPLHGWGCAPWGRRWGSPLVEAEACPDQNR